MADIIIKDGEEVVVQAFTLKQEGADYKLDYQPRRSNNTPHRRTLVHDFQDGITINWANDYPGGVTINGGNAGIDLNGKVSIDRVAGTHFIMEHHDLHLDHAARRVNNNGWRRALVHDFQDGLTLNWASDYPGGVTINGAVKCPGSLVVGGNNIMTLISTMQTKINQLEARVAALEA